MDWSRWLDEAAARAAAVREERAPGAALPTLRPLAAPPAGKVPPELEGRARSVLAATLEAEAALAARREVVAGRLGRLRRAAGRTRLPSIVVTTL